MKAVLLRGGVSVGDVPEPRAAPGEALVRVSLAGVCGTDLELARGYMDFDGIPGHEFVGVVEEVSGSGEERARWVGRRVVAEINLACGACPACLAGLGRHCPTRTVLGILGKDGAHAEKLTIPLRNLHLVPDAVPIRRRSSWSLSPRPARSSIRSPCRTRTLSWSWETAASDSS